MRALVVGVLAVMGCTQPYRIDGSVAEDAGRTDSGLDASRPLDGGPDSPDTPDAFTCAPSCIDASSLSPCAGEDPVPCDLGCIESPVAHCGVMAVANVEPALASAMVNGDVVAANGTIDTTACTWPSLLMPLTGALVDVTDGPRVCLFVLASLSVPGGVVLRAAGDHPLVIVSEGDVMILGELSVDSFREGTMGTGELLGAGSGTGGVMGDVGMASSGMFGAGGGGGGFATSGGDGGNPPGGGGTGGAGGLGASYSLEPLIGGARGGSGQSTTGVTSVGGPGGGALQISSRTRITALGYLGAAGGGGGRGGTAAIGGAGGGSGGAIFLEAPEIMLGGDMNVAGGGGGSGSCLTGTGAPGENGAHETGSPAGGGACGFGGGAGGRGAGGTNVAGNGGNGSGGGGGAGVVRFRVLTPLLLPGSVRLNPRLAPGLYEIGDLEIR